MTQREIKFRAWDERREQMIKEINLGERWIELSFCKIMQYTGLKDKNGKEIWESDIVKQIFESNIGEIKYESVSWIVRYGNGVRYYPLENYISKKGECSLEIIGNIYENPELL